MCQEFQTFSKSYPLEFPFHPGFPVQPFQSPTIHHLIWFHHLLRDGCRSMISLIVSSGDWRNSSNRSTISERIEITSSKVIIIDLFLKINKNRIYFAIHYYFSIFADKIETFLVIFFWFSRVPGIRTEEKFSCIMFDIPSDNMILNAFLQARLFCISIPTSSLHDIHDLSGIFFPENFLKRMPILKGDLHILCYQKVVKLFT